MVWLKIRPDHSACPPEAGQEGTEWWDQYIERAQKTMKENYDQKYLQSAVSAMLLT